jgi:REP element-mobilizing transposase RayT
MIIRSRGYLPHIEPNAAIYFVSFRLADSLPAALLESWKFERQEIIRNTESQNRGLSEHELRRLNYLHLNRIEKFLDSGKGECWLKNPKVASIVVNALKHFDGSRYLLHAWCIMPNHVHVLFSGKRIHQQSTHDSLLVSIMHSWKSFTAKKANEILNRHGKFWQEEYFDTIIRSNRQFAFYVSYILNNPVSAKLCKHYKDWPWSGLNQEVRNLLEGDSSGQDARAPA